MGLRKFLGLKKSRSQKPKRAAPTAVGAPLPSREETRKRIACAREEWLAVQRDSVRLAGFDPDVFLNKSLPQSQLFMLDIIPVIHDLFFSAPDLSCINVLDVGPQTFGGTALLSALHSAESFNRLKMKVSAVDIYDRFDEMRLCLCPEVEFLHSDIFDLRDQTWDLVICSHVIEHVPEPVTFAKRLQELAVQHVIIACPWRELSPMNSTHLHSIDKAFVRQVGGERFRVLTNYSWGKDREVCIFTLPGLAKMSPLISEN